MLAGLRAALGVEDVAPEPGSTPPSVVLTYNRAATDVPTLVAALRRLEVGPPDAPRVVQPIGREGKPVVVPPEPAP